jgi:hypothetical protein
MHSNTVASASNQAANFNSLQITFDELNLNADSSPDNNFVSERVAKMLESNQYSDVIFHVGQYKEATQFIKF